LLDTKYDQNFAAIKCDLHEKEAATQSQLKKLKTETRNQGYDPFVGVSPNRQISALAADSEATGRILHFVQAASEDPSQPSQTVKMQADESYQAVFQRLGQDDYDLTDLVQCLGDFDRADLTRNFAESSDSIDSRCAFASKVAHLRDLELRKLAEGLHLCATKPKAPSTSERYSRALQKFREWSACFEEVVCLPPDELSVALYLEFLLQQSFPYSALESAFVWIYKSLRFKLLRNVLEAAKREVAKPVVKKEPVTPEMISSICNRFAGPSANLSDLRLAAICVTAYSAFLRYNELASLRYCDVSFCDTFVKIYVFKRKTDVYRDGAHVLLAKSDFFSCPFHLLNRY
ncbi:hypothetical protein P5673_027557, partial [Acropora cervicornis]